MKHITKLLITLFTFLILIMPVLSMAQATQPAAQPSGDGLVHCGKGEAVMDAKGLHELPEKLEELGIEPCQEEQLLLKRVFSSNGTNRQFVNGTPTTLQNLKQIGELLVDIHGPHDHQSLLKTEVQLKILDGYAGLEKQRNKFAGTLRKLREVEEKKRSLIMDEQQ